jgi:anhydro-N-acetylmuramic acid kinase
LWATNVIVELNIKHHIGIGLMCGTSHDALDIACVSFENKNGNWSYSLDAYHAVDLPQNLKLKLANATESTGLELVQLDRDFALYCAKEVNEFIATYNQKPSFLSSHGVTIFHNPTEKITTQIGSGAILSAHTNLPVVCDFRAQDVAKNGQGAPLVPYADNLLFHDYEYTLNLGGFANLSFLSEGKMKGLDISPCNLILNRLSMMKGLEFDFGGNIAKKGSVNNALLSKLNALDYYNQNPPKSLGYEWFVSDFLPSFSNEDAVEVQLATAAEHIAHQIAKSLGPNGKCLVTGGGAFNDHLIERIRALTKVELIIPKNEIIQFKEAICFAFLGMLRLMEQTNIRSSVTGAKSDSVAGAVYLP